MKLAAFPVLLTLVIASSALAFDGLGQTLREQTITITIQDQPFPAALQAIEKATGAKFTYVPSLIEKLQRVSIDAQNENLSVVLDRLLKPLQIDYNIRRHYIILKKTASNTGSINTKETGSTHKDISVSGRVTDAKTGESIPGVNVVLKGTTKGTTTDVNGRFSIAANSPEDVLVFSSVGFATQEIPVGNQASVNVTLEADSRTLGEVVVVGYGSQSRRNVTGSVAKVDMKQTENMPNTNVTQSLRGRVAGVQFTDSGRPGQTGSILVRGSRSLSGGNDPLIVLDGIFFNGSLADINPNDIESMEVLKDASAAAIYGSRAANGVILITSKRGTTGKPTIRFNGFTGVSELGRTVKLLSPERYLQKTLDYRAQSGLTADPANVASYLTSSEAANYKAGNTIDPWKAASQPGRISSYDLSLSGRNDATNYYLSAAFTDEKGVIFNDNQKRFTVRANIENQVTNWLTVGLNSTFVRRDLSGREADLTSVYYSSPFGTWTYPDGQPTLYSVPEEQISGNPIRGSLLTKNEEIYNNLFSNFYGLVNVPFVKGLAYRINYSPNFRWNHVYNFTRQDTHVTNNTTSANKFNQESFDWVMENIVTYTKQINRNHEFDVTLLYGRNHQQSESTMANANLLSSDALGWNSLTLGATQTTTSTASQIEGISSMARLNYHFKDRYLLTLTARRDASSVFAANNKYATFPSAALAWVASDESFMRKAPYVDLLKFRLSYGAVGNQAIQPYQSLSLSGITQYVFGDGGPTSVGIYPQSMANSDLKWETTYTANAAVDFSLFKGRLGGTVEVYNSDTKDLIVQRSLPSLTGYTSVLTNLGATNNKGIELTLNTVNLRKKNFEWSSNIVLSTNKNKIVHLYQSDTNGDGKEDDDLANRWFIGQPITVYYDYVFDGIYQQGDQIPSGSQPGFVRLKDLNGDGKIDATNDRTIIGQGGQPKVRWGVTNNFTYGNLSLSVFVNAMQGWISDFILLDPNSTRSENSPGRALNQIDAGWWTPDNKSNTRPSLVYTNPQGHNYYVSRNFVRIQDVSLAYNFPAKWVSKAKVSNLRLFLSAKNLYTFTDWPGTDPESGGTTKASFYPMPRSYTLGLNVGF